MRASPLGLSDADADLFGVGFAELLDLRTDEPS